MGTIRRSSTPKANLYAAAYHEAGHAVAAHFLRVPLGRKGVSIVPDEKWGA